MNIAIIGHGKMGLEVERIAGDFGDVIAAVFDSGRPPDPGGLEGADICIDFSVPGAAVGNMRLASECGVDIVQGTTGWYGDFDEVKEWFSNSALLYAQNFSVGMNMFYRIVKTAAELVDGERDYDPYMVEHHNHDKVDNPSGTALRIGAILLETIGRKVRIQTDPAGGVAPENLHIASIRAGSVPASHTVGFESETDTIELRHVSKNRTGFALGALKAAHWVQGRKGVFTMDDVAL